MCLRGRDSVLIILHPGVETTSGEGRRFITKKVAGARMSTRPPPDEFDEDLARRSSITKIVNQRKCQDTVSKPTLTEFGLSRGRRPRP